MLKVSLIAGSIGRPVGDVVATLRKAYPAKRIEPRERRTSTPERDPRRISPLYDAATNIVYEIQEG